MYKAGNVYGRNITFIYKSIAAAIISCEGRHSSFAAVSYLVEFGCLWNFSFLFIPFYGMIWK